MFYKYQSQVHVYKTVTCYYVDDLVNGASAKFKFTFWALPHLPTATSRADPKGPKGFPFWKSHWKAKSLLKLCPKVNYLPTGIK